MTSVCRICLLIVLGPSAVWAQDTIAELTTEQLAARMPAGVDGPVDFVTDVQPIFREHCFECHAGEVTEGELNLGVKAMAMKGGESGLAILPHDSLASPLIHMIAGIDDDRLMPPDGNPALTSRQIGILRAWIDQGAEWPAGTDVVDPRFDRARQHWAFQRLAKVLPPAMDKADPWPRNEIDVFVQQKLRQHQLVPSMPATPRALVRRLYFDVVGLPPTPAQSSEFVTQYQVNPVLATTDLVEHLLNSPQYGERWARHWLDVARYADSDGQESDRDRPHAYRFRDFVIRAFNDDMPYDKFVRWQIAGDEYEPDNDEAVAATGFLTAGPSMKLQDTFLERERLFNRYNELDDVVSTLGSGLLGLTFGCARCHDHKYDAFSAREYYQLLRVFHSGDRITAKLPSGDDGFFFQDFDTNVRTTWLFRRSDFYDREIEVQLGFPEILSAERDAASYWENARATIGKPKSTLQRRALADWITDAEHGGGALLARVLVNRIWQHHFGQALVRTPGDFGVRGEAPTHPELLEYLTYDFVANGWKVKRLHRKILTSAVWQQASSSRQRSVPGAQPSRAESTRDASQVDPQNRLLWKMTPQRLEAEALRDAMLAISGTLNLQANGPGFKPFIQPEANLARNIQGGDYPQDARDDASTRRRSVYMFHKRLVQYPLFQAFDRPDLMVSCSRRQNTTVAPQAMAILNDRFVRAVAQDFAKRLLASGDDLRHVVQESFELAFARPATPTELATCVSFIQNQEEARQSRNEAATRLEAVADYCHSLFGLNEFIYVD